MKKFFIVILLTLPLITQGQTVLTLEQKLEKAKQEARAAKDAVREAKKAARKAARQARKVAKENKKVANKERIEAEIERAQQEAARYQAEAEKIRKNVILTTTDTDKASGSAQSGWAIPEVSGTHATGKTDLQGVAPMSKMTDKSTDKDDKRYMEGAVPVDAEGKVVFTLNLNVPGKTARQIYDITYRYLEELTKGENQIQSRISLVNEMQHTIAAKYTEWLDFTKSFLSLDRSEFDYTLIAKCTNNHLELTMSRMHYDYEKGRPTYLAISAEEWITDEVALNKKKNRLRPVSSKFRRKTIDRKDEIFGQLTYLLR